MRRTTFLRGLLLLLVLVMVGAACGGDSGGDGDTTADPDEGSETTAEPAAGSETTADPDEGSETTAEAAGDGCLGGEWVLDPESYVEGFGGYLDGLGGLSVGDVSGEMRITVGGDGLEATFTDWTVVLVIEGGGEAVSTTNGDLTGRLTVEDGVITVSDITSTLDTAGSFTVDGVEIDPEMGGFDVGAVAEPNFFVTPTTFTCEGDRLDLETAPPDGASFIVSYDRVE